MKSKFYIFLSSFILAISGFDAAIAADPIKPDGKLTCSSPVSNKDTGETLYDRFGDDVTADFSSDENDINIVVVDVFAFTHNVLVVRLQDDNFVNHVASIEASGAESFWSVAGVKFGTSIQELSALNGRPFKLKIVGDYYLIADDFAGGKLGRIGGSCRLKIQFDVNDAASVKLSINEKEFFSDNPEVLERSPTVDSVFLSWPEK